MALLRQKCRHKVESKNVRVLERVKPLKSSPSATNGTSRAPPSATSSRTRSRPSSTTPSEDQPPRKKRKAQQQPEKSPAHSPLSDDSSGDEAGPGDDALIQNCPGEVRRAPDSSRKQIFRHPEMWDGDDATAKEFTMIHAAEVAKLKPPFKAAWNMDPDDIMVELRYPGSKFPERLNLVTAKDELDPIHEIVSTVKHVANYHLNDPSWFANALSSKPAGLARRIERERDLKNQTGVGFKAALESYNSRMLELQKSGAIVQGLDAAAVRQGIPRGLAAFITEQAYGRTSAQNIKLVQQYDNGTSEVYGELKSNFVSLVVDRLGITSKTVFMDLGSGIGNFVMQMALETGCESWGCEIKENPSKLARAQLDEFHARCRLWGIQPGPVHLEHDDFTKNHRTLDVLKRADVILCNNFVFSPELNNRLVEMFLDLKTGARVVSLKNFVHDQREGSNDVAASILEVEVNSYPEGHVSWTDQGGIWYLSTKK